MAVAALVLGIVSLVFCWISPIGIPSGIIAVILGAIAMNKKPEQKGMALTGLILGAVGVVLAIVLVVVAISAAAALMGSGLNALKDLNSEDLKKAAEEMANKLLQSANP